MTDARAVNARDEKKRSGIVDGRVDFFARGQASLCAVQQVKRSLKRKKVGPQPRR